MERIMCVPAANLFSRLVAGCAGHPDVPQAHRRGVLYGSSRVQVFAAVHDAALQFFHNHLGHVFGQNFAVPSQLILRSWDHKNTASLWWKADAHTVAHCMHEKRSDAFADEKWFGTRELPGMPLPLIVLAMMAVGWWRAWLRALQSSSTLCPSTMIACQLDTQRHMSNHTYYIKHRLCINTARHSKQV